MSDKLTLGDLVDGLTLLGDYFTRFDVFADDVLELDTHGARQPTQPLRRVDPAGRRYAFDHRGEAFEIVISDEGVARIARSETNVGGSDALDSALVDAAVRVASSKKGAGWPEGLILGMGVGRPIVLVGPEPRAKRILTMQFDSSTRAWAAYDGGLVRWLKSEFDRTG